MTVETFNVPFNVYGCFIVYSKLFAELMQRKLGRGELYGLKHPDSKQCCNYFMLQLDDTTYIDTRGIFSSIEELINEPWKANRYETSEGLIDYIVVKENERTHEEVSNLYGEETIEYMQFFIDLLVEKHPSLKIEQKIKKTHTHDMQKFSLPSIIQKHLLQYSEIFIEELKRQLGCGEIVLLRTKVFQEKERVTNYDFHFVLKLDDHGYIDGRGIFSSLEEVTNLEYEILQKNDDDKPIQECFPEETVEYIQFLTKLVSDFIRPICKHPSLKKLSLKIDG